MKKIDKGYDIKLNYNSYRQSGITIVALVVTIIILLILAGITIGAITGNTGLINKAKNSSEYYNQKAIQEKFNALLLTYKIDKAFQHSLTIEEFLNSEKEKGNITDAIENEDGNIDIIIDNSQQTVDKDGNLIGEAGPIKSGIIVGKIKITGTDGVSDIADGSLMLDEIVMINFEAVLSDGTTNIEPSLPYTTQKGEYEKNFHITGTSEGKEYSKDVTISVKSKYNQESMKAQEQGFGNAIDGTITSSKVVNVNENTGIAKIECKELNLNAGETLTVDKPCSGLYIYSQGDIIINGTINMSGKGYYTTTTPNFVTVAGENIILATAGNGGNSKSGNGGGTAQGGIGGQGAYAYGTAGNHTCGGNGNKKLTSGGGGAMLSSYNSSVTNGTDATSISETDNCTAGAGIIVLIAKGKVQINGNIISNGDIATTKAGNGADGKTGSVPGSSNGYIGGAGGTSGTGGDGGGALTIIYGTEYENKGSIQLEGGASAGNGTYGNKYQGSSSKWEAYGGEGGTSGAGETGNIVSKKVTAN